MNIALIGIGRVGSALANHLQQLGHIICAGARDPHSASVRAALDQNRQLHVMSINVAIVRCNIIFLCTPHHVNEHVLQPHVQELEGKVMVDCTNPFGDDGDDHVLKHAYDSRESTTVRLQRLLPRTGVVKVFSVCGYENFRHPINVVDPHLRLQPTMFYCGDHEQAKVVVGDLIKATGWDPVDVGTSEQAVHLEHLALLWIQLCRKHGNFLWSMIPYDTIPK